MRIADLGLNVLAVFVLWQLVTGGPLIALDPTWINQQTWPADALAQTRHMVEIGDSAIQVILGISIFGSVIGIIAKVVKLVTTGNYYFMLTDTPKIPGTSTIVLGQTTFTISAVRNIVIFPFTRGKGFGNHTFRAKIGKDETCPFEPCHTI